MLCVRRDDKVDVAGNERATHGSVHHGEFQRSKRTPNRMAILVGVHIINAFYLESVSRRQSLASKGGGEEKTEERVNSCASRCVIYFDCVTALVGIDVVNQNQRL